MRTGFLVRVIAKSGAAADKTPSAKFVVRLAPQSRLNAGPIDFIEVHNNPKTKSGAVS
ncbi:unannotated protein [freshwater metagenome]|uniref:Unannotated protein n=1 Tax=freshwater metagenome TaxID=449393 RepID=A0A6J6MR96_9ZZZZ